MLSQLNGVYSSGWLGSLAWVYSDHALVVKELPTWKFDNHFVVQDVRRLVSRRYMIDRL